MSLHCITFQCGILKSKHHKTHSYTEPNKVPIAKEYLYTNKEHYVLLTILFQYISKITAIGNLCVCLVSGYSPYEIAVDGRLDLNVFCEQIAITI